MSIEIPQQQWDLIVAVRDGDTERIENILNDGADPAFQKLYPGPPATFDHNDWEWDGHAALVVAAQCGHITIVKLLLSHQSMPEETLGKAMHRAACALHFDIVRVLAQAGAGFITNHDRDHVPISILSDLLSFHMRYLQERHISMARLLLELGADPNLDTRSELPLSLAVEGENQELINVLLSAGADINGTLQKRKASPLEIAAFRAEIGTVSMLLDKGAIPDGKDGTCKALNWAAKRGRVDMMELLLSKGCYNEALVKDRTTALHPATRLRQVKAVRLLLQKRFQIEALDSFRGLTPLMMAAETHDTSIVELLFDAGANIETQNLRKGETVLHHTCRQTFMEGRWDTKTMQWQENWASQMAMTELLLAKGANLQAQNSKGQTPLHVAIRFFNADPIRDLGLQPDLTTAQLLSQTANLDSVKILLAAGADANSVDSDGITPLHIAANQRHIGIMLVLIAAGADVNATDAKKQIALHYAVSALDIGEGAVHNTIPRRIKYPVYYTVETLLNHGADPSLQDIEGKTTLIRFVDRLSLKAEQGWDDSEEAARLERLLKEQEDVR